MEVTRREHEPGGICLWMRTVIRRYPGNDTAGGWDTFSPCELNTVDYPVGCEKPESE
jgi:hypothetical protein